MTKTMKQYSIESSVLFSREKESELVQLMTKHGEIVGTAGGFPVSPMVFKWRGTEEGVEKVKEFGAKVYS